MRTLFGIDIGTSGTKTVLFDENLRVIAEASFGYPLSQPQALWAEQNPADWWKAVKAGIQEVITKSGIRSQEIMGIGLSGQMHGLVLLDKNGDVLRPSIIWCDQRTAAECEQITALIGRERLIEITANPALTGFTASKILWVKNNEPEIFAKTAHIVLPKDYIRYKLTGEFATEVSDASGMQLMDIGGRCWSEEILQKLGIGKELLPKMFESTEVTGTVLPLLCQELGLPRGITVAGGAGDQAAAAIGSGIVREGLVSDTLGTSGVVFAALNKPKIDPKGRVHTFCHAVPGKWHTMGVTQSCGLSVQWLRDNLCQNLTYQEMDALAATVPEGSEGLLYLPHLMGERSPINDPGARGAFFGFSNTHKTGHFVRAVLEGVALSQYDCLNVVRELGASPTEIRLGGGGAKSPLWQNIFADCLGIDIVTMPNTESGAAGAAILAGVAAGVFASVEAACDFLPKAASRICPDLDKHRLYQQTYKRYKRLYEVTREI